MPHQCTNCGRTFSDGSKEMLSGCPACGGNKFQYLPADGADDGSAEPPERFETSGTTGKVTERMARAATSVEEYVAQRRAEEANRQDDAFFDDDETTDADTATSEPGSDDAVADDDLLEETTDSTPATQDGSSADESTGGQAADRDSSGGGMGEFESFTDSEELSKTDRDAEDTAQAAARGSVVEDSDLGEESEDAPPTDSKPTEPPSEGQVVKEPTADSTPDLETLRAELNDQFESIKIVEPGQYELNLMELYDRQEYIISLKEDGKYVVEIPEAWGEGEAEDAEQE